MAVPIAAGSSNTATGLLPAVWLPGHESIPRPTLVELPQESPEQLPRGDTTAITTKTPSTVHFDALVPTTLAHLAAVLPAPPQVGNSQAALLAKLKRKPFEFGLIVKSVFENGNLFDAKILEITDEAMEKSILEGIRTIASVCLAINYPTLASIPHSVVNGYKNVLAIALETDYSFPLADKVTRPVPPRLMSERIIVALMRST